MKKILIHSLVFSPDGVSTAYLYNDIALKFQESGYVVTVLTSTPHYNPNLDYFRTQPLHPKFGGLYFISRFHGMKVIHIPQKKFQSTLMRLLGFVYWHIASFIIAMGEKDVSLILSPSPPITLGLINLVIGRLKHAKVIYNVQEIYPDFLIKQRGLENSLLISVLKKIERIVYNKSDAVTTIDKVFHDTIVDRFEKKRKLHTIPNFVDTDIYRPLQREELNYNADYFKETTALKVMYAGNIGLAQDWDLLISLAINLRDENIEFLVIGDGALKGRLMSEVQRNGLENISIFPYQSRISMPSIISYSDLQFIFMAPDTDGHGFPSKVYTIMACGKPLLISSGMDTPIVRFLEDKNCAWLVTEGDKRSKSNAIANILKDLDPEQLKTMGYSGRDISVSQYSKHTVSQMYIDLANKLISYQ